jgi:hypothetical protein
MRRIIVFACVAAALWTAETVWLASRQPEISTSLALRQVNGGSADARKLREFESLKNVAHGLTGSLILLTGLFLFDPWARRGWERIERAICRKASGVTVALLAGLAALSLLTGCVKAYDRPEYVETAK